MSIGISHLRYFIVSAERGSFRRAATMLNVSQPTLSKRIRELEEHLGVSLFLRSTVGAQLTAAGEDFVRSARIILIELDFATNRAKAQREGAAGRLQVGFYTSLSAGALREVLFTFAQKFKDIDVNLIEAGRSSLLARLDRGNVDMAILLEQPSYQNCAHMNLWSERVLVGFHKAHRFANREVVYWTDLKDEQFLVSCQDPGPEIQDIVLSKLSAPGERPRIKKIEANNEHILSFVGGGQGITVLFESSVGSLKSNVAFRELRDGNGASRVGYSAYWRHDNHSPALKEMLALLQMHPCVPSF